MRIKIALAGLCLSLACAGFAGFEMGGASARQSATATGVKAYVGANVIDGAGKLAVENAALIARDGKVEAVGPASKIKLPPGAQTINLAGKFIIPGLISAHVAEAGLTPAQILRSATGAAARALQVEGIGAITEGAWADFVVLEQDPLKDIRNARSIASVWIAGNQVKGIEPQTRNAK